MRVFCFALVTACLAAFATAADKIQCYQCTSALQECTLKDAQPITCVGVDPHCGKQTKKGATDLSKAIRKCVIPDAKKQISCPDGYDCNNCNKDLCNSATKIDRHLGFLTVIALLSVIMNKLIC